MNTIDVDSFSIRMYRVYGRFDPMMTVDDIKIWVDVYRRLYNKSVNIAITTYVWRRVRDELQKEFKFNMHRFFVDQEVLKERSVNFESYILLKIDAENGLVLPDALTLGKLCRNKHEFANTGKSIRYRNGRCFTCQSIQDNVTGDHKHQFFRENIKVNENIGNVETYLGKLCKNGHDYKGTGKSLRYKKSYNCVECNKIHSREKNGKN